MFWLLYPTLLLPAAALGWIWYSRRPTREQWTDFYKRVGILFAVGVFVAGPFLTRGGLGSGEAYNYSLATADAVEQFRAGVFPPLVGQSEFAFNGRIHPLRTAPYMANFATALDVLTLRQLTFWGLQNLTIALSLMGGVFSAYAMLRRATGIAPHLSIFLAGAYVLSPGVLAPAYSMDLYMTVMSVPWVPIVFGAAVLTLRGERMLWVYALLAVGLAATWLAHPPVAFWLTVAVVFSQAPLVCTWRFKRREIANAIAGASLCGLLSVFGFASALSIHTYKESTQVRETATTVKEVARVFSASLRPVSAKADLLSDFQIGYGFAGLLVLAAVLALGRRKMVPLVLVGVAAFYLALTIPIPGVNAWLWSHAPSVAAELTSHWPMQRLYLLIAASSVFAFAATGGLSPLAELRPKLLRDAGTFAVMLVVGWTIYQGWHFIRRGYDTRVGIERGGLVHRPENINLTVTSYAFVTPPPSFVNGVMDPSMEFSLLTPGTAEPFLSNWTAANAWGDTVQSGTLRAAAGEGEILPLAPPLRLPTTSHYRVDFKFQSPPLQGTTLQFSGPHSLREYPLTASATSQGFGMLPANNHTLSLWTTHRGMELVTLQLVGPAVAGATHLSFADFTVRPIVAEKLPVQVETWIPLRMKVKSPKAGYLETPRIFFDGYAATVNATTVRPRASPNRLTMVPIPAGESIVELSYPGPRLVRIAFLITFAGWVGCVGGGATWIFWSASLRRVAAAGRSLVHGLWRLKVPLVAVGLLAVAGTYGVRHWLAYVRAVGPIEVRLVLPRGETGRSQPLVTTGKPKEGTFLFINYTDETHIRIGMDVWGVASWLSEPIEVDYYADQNFVVTSGALYPPDHPKLKGLSRAEIERLRKRIIVSLNGRTVLDQPVFSFDSSAAEVTVGESRIGGSNTEPKFVGEILHVQRLPIPRVP